MFLVILSLEGIFVLCIVHTHTCFSWMAYCDSNIIVLIIVNYRCCSNWLSPDSRGWIFPVSTTKFPRTTCTCGSYNFVFTRPVTVPYIYRVTVYTTPNKPLTESLCCISYWPSIVSRVYLHKSTDGWCTGWCIRILLYFYDKFYFKCILLTWKNVRCLSSGKKCLGIVRFRELLSHKFGKFFWFWRKTKVNMCQRPVKFHLVQYYFKLSVLWSSYSSLCFAYTVLGHISRGKCWLSFSIVFLNHLLNFFCYL